MWFGLKEGGLEGWRREGGRQGSLVSQCHLSSICVGQPEARGSRGSSAFTATQRLHNMDLYACLHGAVVEYGRMRECKAQMKERVDGEMDE